MSHLPTPSPWMGEGWGGGTKKIRCLVIFSLCINKEKGSVKCVGLNLDSSPGVESRHVLYERPLYPNFVRAVHVIMYRVSTWRFETEGNIF